MTIIAVLIYLLFPVIIILLFQKFVIVQKIGTVLIAYLVGIVMALSGLFPSPSESVEMRTLQDWFMNITVPLAIPLMLFNCNFKLWTKSLPKTFTALICGLIAIVVSVIISYLIFKSSKIQDLPDLSALMVGIYTGGTMNFAAIGKALNIDPNLLITSLTFEMLITFPFIVFLIAGGFRIFRKLLPYSDKSITVEINGEDLENGSFESYKGMFKKNTFPKTLIGLGLSFLFMVIGAGLSLLITGKLNELVVILTITTLGILASFNQKVRELPKTFELGMFFILIFSIVVASQFNIQAINNEVFNVFWFVLVVLCLSIFVHFLLCRLFKVSGDLFTVAIVGMLCSPPFIPPIVGAMKNKKVLISGIVIGLIGYAVGTYLGVLMSLILPNL
ncbi:MAG: DUF819 family protein [Bacteroidales bacterium]|nr:DUF819 family protein [Bacteroidales bacterium]